jgi:hypothetical protein
MILIYVLPVSVDISDKREILQKKLTSAFCSYTGSFHHQPFSRVHEISGKDASDFLKACLHEDSGGGMGMRHASFAAYVILHLIGHNDIELPIDIVKWTINGCNAMGEPTQVYFE